MSDPLVSELLEIVASLEAKSKPVRLDELASRLGCSRDQAEEVLEVAHKKGLIEYFEDVPRLTSRGRTEVCRHREEYVHDRYFHRPGFFGRMVKFFEGSVQDWHNHWRHRHGLDEASVKDFYKGISELEGRVEDVSSLADLPEGGRGTVAFTVGGHGLVRRLAEMGLTPGTEVKVLRAAPFHGPVEVSVRGASLALGRGIASKVFVKAVSREAN
jgi:Fe2+ transport system protein FeoA